MQTRRRSSLLRNGIKIASANANVVEPQQQRQKVVAGSLLEHKKATTVAKTASSKMPPPPSNVNKSNSSGGGIGKSSANSAKIVLTPATAHSPANSSSATSAESPTPLSKTNRIWWRYFTPINELWLLRIRCNNCDWECSMRRGELKFQQLQWHLIGTHPQLWRQKCRDEANENDGMPNLVENQNCENVGGQKEPKKEEADEGEEGQREMEGKKSKKAATAENVAKEDGGQMATAHVQLQEVKQETPDKDATATAIAVKIADVQLQMKEKTSAAQNVEQTVIKQEPPFDEDQWDMEEMRIIPEICAEVGGDEQQQEEEEENGNGEEEMGDEPPNDGIGTKNLDGTKNANNAAQNAKKTSESANAVKNVAPTKLAVLMPSSFAKGRLSGIGTGTSNAAGGSKASLPFELASMPSTSIEIGVGPQQQQQQATGKYDYPDEYSYCILCGKKLADFYVMRLHLRRQHNYLITLDALREKVARFWSDPRASANLFNQRHSVGMKQGRTEFSKKYSQCTVCYRVLCDFYYLYNHMWTQHGYRAGREQLREEIIRHWGLEQANPLEDDNVERIHPFQLMERNDEGDEEVEAEFMEFGKNEGIAEDRENEDGEEDAEMPELFTEESSARSTADEGEDGGGDFTGQDEGGDEDAFGEFDEHPPAKKRPKLTEKSPKREVADGEKGEEDAASNLPPKLPMMAKKSTILASKIAERRRHEQPMMDRVKPATKIFSQMDISRGRQPTNLDNMMIARPVKPPNSKWLRISPTLGLTNTFFMRFLDRQDLRGTRPVLRVVNYSQNVLKLYDGTLACDCHLSPELKRTALDRGISTFFAPGIRVMLTDFRQIYNRNAQIGRVQPILVINHMRRLDIDIKNYSMIKAAEQQEQKQQRQTAGQEKGGGDQQKPSSSSGIGGTAGTGPTTMFNRTKNIVPCMRLPREQQQLRRILFGNLPTRLRPYYPPLKPVSAELMVQKNAKEKQTAQNTGSSPIKFYSIESPPKLVPSQQHQKKMPSTTPAAGMAPKLAANSSAPVAANLTTPIKEECPQLVKEEYYEGSEQQQGVAEN